MTEGLQLGTRFYVKYVPQLRFGEAQRERCRLEGGLRGRVYYWLLVHVQIKLLLLPFRCIEKAVSLPVLYKHAMAITMPL